MSVYENIILDKSEGIATIWLNRPEALNAINNKMRMELLAALDDVKSDSSIRVLIITGSGRAFSAGGDMRAMGTAERMIRPNQILHNLSNLDKPVIAAVNGTAAGAGCSLALAADITVAAEGAKFVLSFARIGLVPDWGGMYFLPRRVGFSKAKELIFSSATVPAAEAREIGMVERVAPDKNLAETVRKMALKITEGAPVAIAMTKQILSSQHTDLATVLTMEYQAQTVCRQTEDHKEGLLAFKEKRQPDFTGR